MRTEALKSSARPSPPPNPMPATLDESSVIVAFSVTSSGRIIAANRTMLQAAGSRSLDQLLGKSLPEELLAEADDWQHWQTADSTGYAKDIETRLRVGDGKDVVLRGDIRRIARPGGGDSLLSGLFVDVTNVKHLENALQRSARMEALSALVTGAVHDFNNILTVLVGNLYLVGESVRENKGLFDKVKAARDVARRGTELIGQLLSFARPGPPQTGNVDVAKLVERLEPLLTKAVGSAVKLSTRVGEHVSPVNANAALLESAIVNLVINARDALGGPGSVSISVDNVTIDRARAASYGISAGQYVRTAVADDGPGVPAELQSRIFEPFFTTKGESGGTGLGLAMVRRLAEQSQGTVNLSSEPGRGTTISILLPSSEINASDTSIKTMPLSTLPTGDESVLVVAENGEVLSTVEQILNVLGYRVRSVTEPSELPAQLEAAETDLVIIDNSVNANGSMSQLEQKIRELGPRTKTIRIDEAGMRQPDSSPAAHVLIKPFSLMDLASAVRKTLDGEARD